MVKGGGNQNIKQGRIKGADAVVPIALKTNEGSGKIPNPSGEYE